MNDAVTAQLREAVRTIQALRARVATLQTERSPPVAVVGMACRFAGANDPAGLWKVLAGGVDTVRPTPPDRWDNAIWHSPDPDAPGRVAFREAAFLDDVDSFDNALFGIAAREAAGMDPQHRLLLELAWSALEHAAIRPDGLAGTATGVFLGLNGGDHMMAALAAPERVGSHALAGAVGSIAAGRIAYAFGLTGPAMVVDTACSSSLVAVHLAVQSLRRGECAMALAGGAHLMLAPNVSVALSRARMMAPDGRCKAFDAAADGFGQGEGGGMVVLKRLADAEAAGDRVLAVIAGSALNQDGRSAGITAPNQRAQEAVIRAALEDAGCTPEQVDAVEAHGTGTGLGDPLELHALAAVFAGRTRALPVGSVKTNVGHTAAAAGVAGLIKAVLMLQRQAVPPVVHFRRLNPHISLDGVPIEIPAALRPMALGCVGVSSFGFSGTNAHVVLTRPPDRVAAVAAEHAPGLLLSARSAEALRSLIDRTRAAVAGGLAFADACHTAWRGRARFEWWVHAGSPAALDEAAFGRVEPRRGPIPELLAQAPQAGQAGRIGDMPGVAFDRQHFPRIAGARSTPDALYPGQRIDTPSDDRMLECVLDLQAQPWLGDHRVQDRVVVPGAVMVALLLSVAATDGLADIRFVEPVIMEHAPVRLVAIARPDGSLAVGSRGADGWIWHATARAIAPQVTAVHPSTLQAPAPQRPVLQAPLSPVAAPAPWTDAASPLGAAGSAAPAMGREQWTGHLAAMGITIGSVFQGIASITPGPVTTAVIDASRLGDPVGGAFHPALLDAVLQVAGGVLPAEPVLPVGIGSLTLHAPLAAPLHITARLRGEAVDLLAHSGPRLVASVEGLTVRRLGDTLPPVVAAVTWRAAAAVAGVERPAVFQVAPGGENLGEALVLVRRLLAEPRSVVFLTGGAVPPVSDPGAAAFAGLASALAAERPELRCRCVDIAPGTPDLLVERELASADAEPLVALRPDGRFVPRLLRLAGAAGSLRLSGTVLITGGMGGIGRHAAAWAGPGERRPCCWWDATPRPGPTPPAPTPPPPAPTPPTSKPPTPTPPTSMQESG